MENQENQDKIKTDDGVNSVIDIRGIQFDISSVLKDVTNSIKNNLKMSFDDVFKDYELYKSTHDALLQIPYVKDLYNKNSELSLQVKLLNQQEQQQEQEEHEPSITLNIHESFNPNNNNDDDEPSSLRTDFLKTNKMNKKQSENDFEFEIGSEAEEEEEADEEEADEEEEAEEEAEE